MWDLALMDIFTKHPFYMGYSSSQYGTRVLQTSPLKLLMSSLRPHHAAL